MIVSRGCVLSMLAALSLGIAVLPLGGAAAAATNSVVWTESIQGSVAGEVDPNAAILTHPNGDVTFGSCINDEPTEAIETWTSGDSLVGSRPVTASPDPQLCEGTGLTDAQGDIYSLLLNQAADTYDMVALKPDGTNLWPAPAPLPTTCAGNPLSLGYSQPVIGADGNIYGLVYYGQGGSCQTATKLYGINHQTGALLFADTLNPDGGDVSAYDDGLVVRADNQISYYNYGGVRIAGPFAMGGEQMDHDEGVAATTSGRVFVATGKATTPTSTCPLTFTLNAIEAYQPSGRVWRTSITACEQALQINAMPDGGVAMLMEEFTTGTTPSSEILRYNSTGTLLWPLPASDMLIDTNGNIITETEYHIDDPDNPLLNNEPEVRVDVYDGLTGTEIYDFDTANFNDDNSYVEPVNAVGLAEDRIYLGLQECLGNIAPTGEGSCGTAPQLYAINAPGVGIDYPRGAVLGEKIPTIRYVALGDSYSSGEGNPPFINPACDLSSSAWPNLLAESDTKILLLANLACTGAKASDALTAAYHGQSPQLSEIKTLDPTLVTITIGGDDVGFVSVIAYCYGVSIAHRQSLCVEELKEKEARVIRAFGKKAVGYYKEIKKAAGLARVIVVGYPRIFATPWEHTHGCWWLSDPEQQEFYNIEVELNSVLSSAAKKAGLQYIPTLSAFNGHELCTASPWLNSIKNSLKNKIYYAHPNLKGQQSLAKMVAAKAKL